MSRKQKGASRGREQRDSAQAGAEETKKPPLVIEFVFNQPPKCTEHGIPADTQGAQAVPEEPKRVIFDFRE